MLPNEERKAIEKILLEKSQKAAAAFYGPAFSFDLEFRGVAPNPYANDPALTVAVTADRREHLDFWTDAATGRLVQVTPESAETFRNYRPRGRLAPGILYDKALFIACGEVEGFMDLKLELAHDTAAEGLVNLYRWDDWQARDPETGERPVLPPFLQVGLYPDGRIAAFTNALRLRPVQNGH